MNSIDKKKRLVETASGRRQADIVIKNAQIADVFGGKWLRGDVAVCGGEFAGVGSYSGKHEIDGSGKYVMPSFYDAHLHFESAMLRPSEYLKLSVAKGVTAYNADPHEIANVLGGEGIRFMTEDVRGIPADVRFMAPSCVPACGEDHPGAVLDSGDVKRLTKELKLFGIGEMMNFPGVLDCDREVLKKLDTRYPIDGHAPFLSGNRLNAYISSGIMTDHECVTAEEAAEKISKGMYIMLREGSQARNLRTVIKAVNRRCLSRFMFCSDDRNIEDLSRSGTISECVRLAVECGLSSIDAITIASLNASAAYGIKRRGAIAPGFKADFIIAGDEAAQDIQKVFYHGIPAAENGKPLFTPAGADTDKVKGTVHINLVTADDMFLHFRDGLPAIKVFPDSVVTEKVYRKTANGLNLMCVVERHKATGNIGRCYVEGIALKGGAIAQTIGHDAHNITVLGDNPRDMAVAVNALGPDGGLALVKSGGTASVLPLEIAGLMTSQSAEALLEKRAAFFSALAGLGYNRQIEPLMLLSFLTLTVIPDVKLNDTGLFSVSERKYLYKC